MRFVVTGASGLIGSRLVGDLRGAGHDVITLVRRKPAAPTERRWDPASRQLDPDALGGADAVVHLAGVGIAGSRLTGDHKRAVLESRVDGTTAVAAAVSACHPVPALLSASAVGWYGDRGSREIDEREPAGTGFLADVCRAWEGATAPAARAGARVVTLRTGLVLSPKGGVLGRIRPLFAAGVGGKLGSGKQYWPWVSLADEVGAIRFLLEQETGVTGPVNLTGPGPVTNAQFTRTLGGLLHRPTVLPVPRFALRVALGDFADEGVLVSQRAVPAALLAAGYSFEHPTLESALSWALSQARQDT